MELTVIVGICEFGCSGETVLELGECLSLSSSPCEHFVLLGQVREWLGELSVVLDEVSVEVGEAEEAPDTMYIGWCGPFCDCFHLGVIHLDAVMVDEHP